MLVASFAGNSRSTRRQRSGADDLHCGLTEAPSISFDAQGERADATRAADASFFSQEHLTRALCSPAHRVRNRAHA
jgi:hypothetical protein